MARAIWLPGGGGADLDVVTADAGDVLAGKVIVGPDGEPLTGTLALSGNASDGQVLSGQTYYNTDAKTKRTGTMPNRGAVNQSLAINGSYTIPAGYHNGSGKVTQDIPTKGAQTYTPGTTNQTIAANQYLTGPQTIKGDPNLKAENIKKGVSIMGITGSFEGYVTSPLYLYNKGTWNGLQTTGFTVVDGTENYIEAEGNIRFTCSGIGNKYVVARSNSPFLFSGRSYLKLNMSVSRLMYYENKVYIGLSPNPSLTKASISSLSAKIIVDTEQDTGTINIIPISSISGNHYVYVAIINGPSGASGTTQTVSIDQIFVTNN